MSLCLYLTDNFIAQVEYRITALTATGTILQELRLDMFKELYDIVSGHLATTANDSDKENGQKEDDDKDENQKVLELQCGILTCLGLAWPETRETQDEYITSMLDHLDATIQSTTRKNQLAVAKCLGHLMRK